MLIRVLLIFSLCLPAVSLGQQPRLLVLGDSISAAYGMQTEQGWVSLLQQELQGSYHVVNASISGETTAGGLARLPALLAKHQPAVVVIELGGNDGLRGFPITGLRSNLSRMAQLASDNGASVLLAAMRIPPNYGRRYTDLFFDSYEKTAKKYQTALVPFLLAGIATRPELMQTDGIHPNADAQPLILQNVLPHLKPLL